MSEYISIPLGKGKYALIDAADAALVLASGYRWRAVKASNGGHTLYAYGYRCPDGSEAREHEYLHRVIMPTPDGVEVDHVDGNGLDCRRSNMRACTPAQNSANRRRRVKTGGQSQYRGVRKASVSKKHGQRWGASIGVHGRHIWLGTFATEEDAARGFDKAARELHGEFAVLNFPDDLH